jgi:hypothetical protein
MSVRHADTAAVSNSASATERRHHRRDAKRDVRIAVMANVGSRAAAGIGVKQTSISAHQAV